MLQFAGGWWSINVLRKGCPLLDRIGTASRQWTDQDKTISGPKRMSSFAFIIKNQTSSRESNNCSKLCFIQKHGEAYRLCQPATKGARWRLRPYLTGKDESFSLQRLHDVTSVAVFWGSVSFLSDLRQSQQVDAVTSSAFSVVVFRSFKQWCKRKSSFSLKSCFFFPDTNLQGSDFFWGFVDEPHESQSGNVTLCEPKAARASWIPDRQVFFLKPHHHLHDF